MSEDVYGRIGLLASRFRNAIDLALNESAEVGLCLRSFPKGCCGAASELLAQYLFENGIAATYVDAAHYYDNEETAQNHAWLEVYPRLVVDITRDQFPMALRACSSRSGDLRLAISKREDGPKSGS